jgi:low affinity Fe/Cu permease
MANKNRKQGNGASSSGSSGLAHQFSEFSRAVSQWSGNTSAFLLATAVVLIWMMTGPLFNYSDTWQLVINTGTTIVTFLMVFLIQATQNRDAEAVQVKLDEIIRAIGNAQNELLDLEELEEEDLDKIRATYHSMAEKARGAARTKASSASRTNSQEPRQR